MNARVKTLLEILDAYPQKVARDSINRVWPDGKQLMSMSEDDFNRVVNRLKTLLKELYGDSASAGEHIA